jgi:hypothetical protein
MASAPVRAGRFAARALLAAAGFALTEGLALAAGFSPVGFMLAMVAQPLVVIGPVAGLAALGVGLLRRRRSGGITAVDLAVHAALLANTALLVLAFVLRPAGLGADVLLGLGVASGTAALIGIPASVYLSWLRAFRAPDPVGAPTSAGRRWILRVAHAVNLAAAVALLLPTTGPFMSGLLGSR